MSSPKDKTDKPLYVTSPLMPDFDEFAEFIKPLWTSRILTNNGQNVKALEKAIGEYLGEKFVSVYANGTLPILAVCRALGLKGEVITTPYTFIATSHALQWSGLQPVFVDIDPRTGNIDPTLIENAITDSTCAILPVHVYGNPCDTDAIDRIAKRNNLPVIYDAAHAFGVKYKGKPITSYGDFATMSFHATKVFNTIEGGAVICRDEATKRQLDYLRNFGFESETEIAAVGINAKLDEMRAAFGLLNLKNVDKAIEIRRHISDTYSSLLKNIPGITFLTRPDDVRYNFSHYPILLEDKHTRDSVYHVLKSNNIFSRRYFYPLVTDFAPYNSTPGLAGIKVAHDISNRILCLPLHTAVKEDEVQRICRIIAELLQKT